MVKSEMKTYLTDFLNRVFAGEIAKNHGFGGDKILTAATIYHSNINYALVLRKLGGIYCAVPFVIPCAPRHEVTLRRHGIFKGTGVGNDPG